MTSPQPSGLNKLVRRSEISNASLVVTFVALFPLALFAKPNTPVHTPNTVQHRNSGHPLLAILIQRAGTVKKSLGKSAQSPQLLSAVSYDSGGQGATSVAIGDVNGDGNADVVVANQCASSDANCAQGTLGTIGVLLGNGDGTLRPVVSYPSGGHFASSIALADVNGDAQLDAVVSNSNDNTIAVLLGNGDGSFRAAVSYPAGGSFPASVSISDVNGDQKPDILVIASCQGTVCPTSSEGELAVLLGNGDGTFQAAMAYDVGAAASDNGTIADVNGDGKPDVIVSSYCFLFGVCNPAGATGGVSVLLGNGDGTFQNGVVYLSGAPSATSVAVADVNGDSKLDVVVSNHCSIDSQYCFPTTVSTVGVLLGNGDGTFADAVTYDTAGWGATSVAITDVNGDIAPDVVVVNTCGANDALCQNQTPGNVAILLGNGDGTFQTGTTYNVGPPLTAIKIADLIKNDAPDVVVAGGNSVSVLLNIGPNVLLQSSSNPAALGQAVTIAADVTSLPGQPTPTGTLALSDGPTMVGTQTLSGGTASFSLNSLTAGSHSLSAVYSGDLNYHQVTSAVLVQVVSPADFTLDSFTLTPNPLLRGQSAAGTITIDSTTGFTGAVSLICSVSPQVAIAPTCSLMPASLNLVAGGTATSKLTISTTPSSSAWHDRPSLWYASPLFSVAWLFVVGLVVVGTLPNSRVSRRKSTALFGLLIIVCALWASCGGGGVKQQSGGTPSGKYTVTLNAIAGQLVHSASFNLSVN